ncbi:MAG: hypothetical protein MJ071_07245 [Oscillospiraceae bacterium]|nr:hypothetical protein [Oscillospiraceae bacterium]
MYQIQKEQVAGQKTLILPSMFDYHYPLLKYAFCSEEYYPVVLDNAENIVETGLKHVNNDMCFPCIIDIGQIICALKTGNFDLNNTLLLMPTFGECCLGSNYTEILKKVLEDAGIHGVKVITFSMKEGETNKVHMQYFMYMRAFFSMHYCDLLLYLTLQIRPYEVSKGDTDRCRQKWLDILSEELRTGTNMNPLLLKRRFKTIISDFAAIPQTGEKKQRIGIVGELFTRYCHFANRDIVRYLEDEGCEVFINGLSSYFLYYMDTHKKYAEGAMRFGYTALSVMIGTYQKILLRTLRKSGMFAFTDYGTLKKAIGKEKAELDSVGDGWLISMDTLGCFQNGIRKILGVQAFRCIPSHIYGRGQYMSMMRKYHGRVVSLDFDSSLPDVNIQNRIQLLISNVIDDT